MVASVYSYNMPDMEMEADKKNKIFWSIIFILFPIVLIFLKILCIIYSQYQL